MEKDLDLLLKCISFQTNNIAALNQALLDIASMCLNNDDAMKNKSKASKALALIQDLIVNCKYREVQETAMYCLSCGIENNVFLRQDLYRRVIFTTIRSFLSCRDLSEKSKQVAILLTMCLVSNCGTGQSLVRECGCLELLLQLFTSSFPVGRVSETAETNILDMIDVIAADDCRDVWIAVTRALSVCASNPQNLENQRVCARTFPDAFKYLTKCDNLEIVRPLTSFIVLTTTDNADNKESIFQCDGLEVLISTLYDALQENKSTDLIICYIDVLEATITDDSIKNVKFCGDRGLIGCLVKILSDLDLPFSAKIKVVLVLRRCTENTERHRTKLKDLGGLTLLEKMLTESIDDELCNTIECILQNCNEKNPDQPNVMTEMGNPEEVERNQQELKKITKDGNQKEQNMMIGNKGYYDEQNRNLGNAEVNATEERNTARQLGNEHGEDLASSGRKWSICRKRILETERPGSSENEEVAQKKRVIVKLLGLVAINKGTGKQHCYDGHRVARMEESIERREKRLEESIERREERLEEPIHRREERLEEPIHRVKAIYQYYATRENRAGNHSSVGSPIQNETSSPLKTLETFSPFKTPAGFSERHPSTVKLDNTPITSCTSLPSSPHSSVSSEFDLDLAAAVERGRERNRVSLVTCTTAERQRMVTSKTGRQSGMGRNSSEKRQILPNGARTPQQPTVASETGRQSNTGRNSSEEYQTPPNGASTPQQCMVTSKTGRQSGMARNSSEEHQIPPNGARTPQQPTVASKTGRQSNTGRNSSEEYQTPPNGASTPDNRERQSIIRNPRQQRHLLPRRIWKRCGDDGKDVRQQQQQHSIRCLRSSSSSYELSSSHRSDGTHRDAIRRGDWSLKFQQFDDNSHQKQMKKCPGCFPPSQLGLPFLNSRTFNISLETSSHACDLHRFVRQLERSFAAYVKRNGDVKRKRPINHRLDRSSDRHDGSVDSDDDCVCGGVDVYDFTGGSGSSVLEKMRISPPKSDTEDENISVASPRSKLASPVRRRPRVPYSDEEVSNLTEGVTKHGKFWNRILCAYRFHSSRTAVDLMEKFKRLNQSHRSPSVSSSASRSPSSSSLRSFPLSMAEERRLRRGVHTYGHNWTAILNALSFAKGRSTQDLRNKWRSLHKK